MSDTATILAPSAWTTRALALPWALTTGALAIAVLSPFEVPLPGAALAGLTLTTTEAAVLAGCAAVALVGLVDPRLLRWRSSIARPGTALLLVMLVAALAAPEFRAHSLRVVARLCAAGMVVVLVQSAITSAAIARRLLSTLLVVGALVGGIAVLEAAQVPAVIDVLTVFRPGFHVVGGQVRATSTLIYPTIASMYLEGVFALGLALLAPGRRWVFGALVLVGAGVIATFTRAGLISMGLSLLCVGVALYVRRGRWTKGHATLAALAVVLLGFVLMSRSPQMLLMRFGTDTSQDWYGARYEVPDTLRVRPGGVYDVPVKVTNHGLLPWQSTSEPVFALSYHWLNADTEDVVQFDGARTPFPVPVATGETAAMAATVRVPGYPGSYVLVWDVVQEHRAWLSTEGILPARTRVTVEGPQVSAPLASQGRLPGASNRMPRRTLWKAAMAIAADHPIAGVGPDNYRQVYGRYLGLANWDTRVHANNMYLEVLTGSGVLGLGALVWLLTSAGLALVRRWRSVPDAQAPMLAAVTAAGLSIAGHGLVDSFLTFTSTYVLFALVAGLLCSPGLGCGTEADAHRL